MKKNRNILLKDINNKLPFTVPENYFNDFAAEIDRKIAPEKPVTRLFFRSWMYVAAASLIGVVILSQVYFWGIHNKSTTVNADNYESYVLSQVDEPALMDYYLENK